MIEIRLSLADELRGRIRLGAVGMSPVEVGPASQALEEESERLCRRLRHELTGASPSEIEALRPARDLYKSFGIDPTKIRPSSEALLRRVLKEKPMPTILNAVDLCNLLALDFLLPLGLYDSAKIRGPVLLRAGRPGESFAGIRKGEVHLEGRPVLVDETGPFGNPTSDSLRTTVDRSTTALWMVIFAPATYSTSRIERHVASALDGMERHLAPSGVAVERAGEVVFE